MAVSPPARGAALVGLLRAAWREYELDHARYFAGSMVYFALMSLLPLLLLVLAVLGLLLRYSDLAAAIEQDVLRAVETALGGPVRATVEQLFEQLEQESVIATAISLVGLVLTASALFRHLRLSFRALWKYTPPLASGTVRGVIRATALEYAAAYLMVLTGGLLVIAALALVSITQWVGGLLVDLPLVSRTPAWVLALPGSAMVVGLTFAFLLKFLPPVRLAWRDVWLATVLCTGAWIIGAEILVLTGALIGPSASGAFGALLVLMLWLNVVSQLLFYGAEICKLVHARDARPAASAPSGRVP